MLEAMNLVVIMDDEHNEKKMLGHAGHPQVKTPHLDRLAAAGTVFSNASGGFAHLRRAGARRLCHRPPCARNRLLGQRHRLQRPAAQLGPCAA